MRQLLAVLVCLGLTGATVGYRLPYIINGRRAQLGEFPWQAALLVFGRLHCGAALVTRRWLVTAAHCVPYPASEYEVLLGAHDIKTLQEGTPRYYYVAQVIAHPQYKKRMSDPDIGLIKLPTKAPLNTYVDTITLAAKDVGDLAGADCVITGWGIRTAGTTRDANILQVADTTPLTNAACEAAVKIVAGDGVINDSHICIGGVSIEGACKGDSGGPLVCTLSDGSKVLAGVISWGESNCRVSLPNVCSRVSYFRDWLSANSNGEV